MARRERMNREMTGNWKKKATPWKKAYPEPSPGEE
jgi:hypothetical protein